VTFVTFYGIERSLKKTFKFGIRRKLGRWQSGDGWFCGPPFCILLPWDKIVTPYQQQSKVGMSKPSVRFGPRCPQRPGPDRTLGRVISGESEILSGGQSQVLDGQPSRTSETDSGRVRNVTEFFFFLERGGQNTSQKNVNQGISDFSQFHVCFRHSEPFVVFSKLIYRIF